MFVYNDRSISGYYYQNNNDQNLGVNYPEKALVSELAKSVSDSHINYMLSRARQIIREGIVKPKIEYVTYNDKVAKVAKVAHMLLFHHEAPFSYVWKSNCVLGSGVDKNVYKGFEVNTKTDSVIAVAVIEDGRNTYYEKCDEIKMARRFNSPHVMKAGNFFNKTREHNYYVLPQANGDLTSLPKNLNFRDKHNLAMGLARGVKELHDSGWHHNDLKSANVLYFLNGNEFTAVITDLSSMRKFGTAISKEACQLFYPLKAFRNHHKKIDSREKKCEIKYLFEKHGNEVYYIEKEYEIYSLAILTLCLLMNTDSDELLDEHVSLPQSSNLNDDNITEKDMLVLRDLLLVKVIAFTQSLTMHTRDSSEAIFYCLMLSFNLLILSDNSESHKLPDIDKIISFYETIQQMMSLTPSERTPFFQSVSPTNLESDGVTLLLNNICELPAKFAHWQAVR